MDLDEMEITLLMAEIVRRMKVQSMNVCDYCGRDKSSSPCKFIKRHSDIDATIGIYITHDIESDRISITRDSIEINELIEIRREMSEQKNGVN